MKTAQDMFEEKVRWYKKGAAQDMKTIEAMRTALKTREKLIEDTIADLVAEKRANLWWCEFAHKAVAELAKYRELLTAAGYDPDHIEKEANNESQM
jgi:xylose isomerase